MIVVLLFVYLFIMGFIVGLASSNINSVVGFISSMMQNS